jgi:microcystin-dependent protein
MPKTNLLRRNVDVNSAQLEAEIGTIKSCASDIIPSGFLNCNGQIVLIADYPKLFDVVGTRWGHGNNDGLSFHLPDLRGRFLRGQDDGAGRDEVSSNSSERTASNPGGVTGDNVGTVQNDKTRRPRSTSLTGVASTVGSHRHTISDFTIVNTNSSGSRDDWTPTGSSNQNTSFAGQHSHTVSISGGGDFETRPQNAAVKYIIKAL